MRFLTRSDYKRTANKPNEKKKGTDGDVSHLARLVAASDVVETIKKEKQNCRQRPLGLPKRATVLWAMASLFLAPTNETKDNASRGIR